MADSFREFLTESSKSEFGITKKKNSTASREGSTVYDFIMNGVVIAKLAVGKRQVKSGARSVMKTVRDLTWEYDGLKKALNDPSIAAMGSGQKFFSEYQTSVSNPEDLDRFINNYNRGKK